MTARLKKGPLQIQNNTKFQSFYFTNFSISNPVLKLTLSYLWVNMKRQENVIVLQNRTDLSWINWKYSVSGSLNAYDYKHHLHQYQNPVIELHNNLCNKVFLCHQPLENELQVSYWYGWQLKETSLQPVDVKASNLIKQSPLPPTSFLGYNFLGTPPSIQSKMSWGRLYGCSIFRLKMLTAFISGR